MSDSLTKGQSDEYIIYEYKKALVDLENSTDRVKYWSIQMQKLIDNRSIGIDKKSIT